MRKTLGVLLILLFALMMGMVCAHAEEQDILFDFEPIIINGIGLSAEEWFSTEENRALITILLEMEYAQIRDDLSILYSISGDTYVALSGDGEGLIVIYYFDGQEYYITYHPKEGTAKCLGPIEATLEDVERVLDSMKILGGSNYRNAEEALLKILEAMKEVFE